MIAELDCVALTQNLPEHGLVAGNLGRDGHVGQRDLHVTDDSQTWINFLRKERNIVWALLRCKIRLQGPPKLLLAFGKCFPQ